MKEGDVKSREREQRQPANVTLRETETKGDIQMKKD